MPGNGGIELIQDILRIGNVSVIFLSAYGRDETIARGFETGAVDYLDEPFPPTELTARMASALRRREVAEPVEPYVLGDPTINYPARRASVAVRQVQLTTIEYR